MKLNCFLPQKIAYFVIVILALLLVSSCTKYQGDGIVVNSEYWSFYPSYEIRFPSFPFEQGIITQHYRFKGICPCPLHLKIYFIDKLNKQIKFRNLEPQYIAELKVKVKLIKNGTVLIERDEIFTESWSFSGSAYRYKYFGENSKIDFDNQAKYELFLTIQSEIEPPEVIIGDPKAVKMQVALLAS